jgi:hypothetical protein
VQLTLIGVKLREIRNLYVLVVFAPRSRRSIFVRRVSRRPWPLPRTGDLVCVTKQKLRVTSFAARIERRGDDVEHITEIFTRAIAQKRTRTPIEPASNVVRMPVGDGSVIAEFIRYHVLVRVFHGDPDAWLAHLLANGDAGGDLRFVRRLRSRLRQEPALIITIRRMVDATPFWRVAEA